MKIGTDFSQMFKIGSKRVVLFLRKTNLIECYYLDKIIQIEIKNDKNEVEIDPEILGEKIKNEYKKLKKIDKKHQEYVTK